jgi:hypothetical protein
MTLKASVLVEERGKPSGLGDIFLTAHPGEWRAHTGYVEYIPDSQNCFFGRSFRYRATSVFTMSSVRPFNLKMSPYFQ